MSAPVGGDSLPGTRPAPRRIRVRTFAKFGIPLLILVGLTVGHSGYRVYRRSDESHRRDVHGRLQMAAEVLAASLDADLLSRLQSPTDFDRPEYVTVIDRLKRAAANTDLAWIGIFREVDGRLYMIADLGETGIGYPFFYATPEHWAALREGSPREVHYTDEFGSYVGHVAAIRNGQGVPIAIVEASVHRDLLEMFAQREGASVLRSLTFAAFGAMLLVLLLTGLLVERPLRRLRQGVQALSQGDFDHTLEVRGHDEFAQLADAFNGMAADLKKLYGGLEGLVQARTRTVEAKNAELETTLKQLQDTQDLLLQREKMAAVGQLVSGVAHELNNPLAGIMGHAQICIDRTDDPRLQNSLRKICEEGERAARIVRNLLTFSRKSAGEASYVDVNEVIRQTIELREYHLRVDDITVELRLWPTPLRTLADQNQLQQVFLNIVNNAAHAVRGRHGVGHIRIESESRDDRIFVRVADNGPGVPTQHLTRIFDPFFTTKEVGEGTGLGLSICFGIVRQHQGTIRAANLAEGGAEFTIELPIMLGADRRPQAEDPAPAAAGSGAP